MDRLAQGLNLKKEREEWTLTVCEGDSRGIKFVDIKTWISDVGGSVVESHDEGNGLSEGGLSDSDCCEGCESSQGLDELHLECSVCSGKH